MQAGPARRILRNWHGFCMFKGDDTIPVEGPRHDPVREAGGCIKGEHIMKLGDIYIMGAVRTAIGKYGGSLKNVPAHELASLVIRESLNRSGVPDSLVDEVILGEVRQTTEGVIDVARRNGVKLLFFTSFAEPPPCRPCTADARRSGAGSRT